VIVTFQKNRKTVSQRRHPEPDESEGSDRIAGPYTRSGSSIRLRLFEVSPPVCASSVFQSRFKPVP
jgi:hypothetical protein